MSIKDAKDGKDAKEKARKILDENNFAMEEGFFSASKADWYVVGGRWSTEFRKYDKRYSDNKDKLREEVEKVLSKNKIDTEYEWLEINPHLVNARAMQEIEELSLKLTGYPFFVDTYKDNEKDACIKVTKEIAKDIIVNYEDSECLFVTEFDEIEDEKMIVDIEAKDIEGTWLVIIDYHN